MMQILAAAILAAVEGDLNSMAIVQAASNREIVKSAAMLPPLTLKRSALEKVLEDWRRSGFAPEDIQLWASFVRRGCVSGVSSRGTDSIDIEYDAKDEELIAEIISRFDEIGDLIDGYVDAQEQDEMLRALRA